MSRLIRSVGLLVAVFSFVGFAPGEDRQQEKSKFTQAEADALIAKLPPGDPWERRPDASTLAWGESHFLHTLMNLYEATGDRKYLQEVAYRGDRLLKHRDDRRGVTDGSGRSRPAWSMADKYVVAEASLLDGSGKSLIALRSTPASHNNLTHVEVTIPDDARSGRFSIIVTNSQFKRQEQFSNLSLDPQDKRFVEKIVNATNFTHFSRPGTYNRHSNLLRARVLGEADQKMVAQSLQLNPIPLAFMGYLGVIYHPMLRFAEIVKTNSQYKELVAPADRFILAAEESYADATKRLWRDGPNAGEGYYLCSEKGESFPYDNVGEPFNYLGRHTAAHLALFRLTGKKEYRQRAEQMSRLFKNRLKYDAERDLYTWHYWYEPVTTTGWTPSNSPSMNIPNFPPVAAIEDTSHGVLDIAMVINAHAAGLVFDDIDLKRFANTLLKNVLAPDLTGVNRRVDGSGGVYPGYFPALSGWIDLAVIDPAVYQRIRRIVEKQGTDNPQIIAALLKWEKKLSETKALPAN